MSYQLDSRGVPRGECSQCKCFAYEKPATGNDCEFCHHKPLAHKAMSLSTSSSNPSTESVATDTTPLPTAIDPNHIPKVIIFGQSVSEPYYEFSNFAPGFPIVVNNKDYATTEHFFQAHKFALHPHLMEFIRTLPTPEDAYEAAVFNMKYKRPDWEQVNNTLLSQALYAKFSQNLTLKHLLLSTGDAIIVNHASDKYWGDGGDGSGRNRLGELIMQTRASLLSDTSAPPPVTANLAVANACKICAKPGFSMALIPCGHTANMCTSCADKVKTCGEASCGVSIQTYVKLKN